MSAVRASGLDDVDDRDATGPGAPARRAYELLRTAMRGGQLLAGDALGVRRLAIETGTSDEAVRSALALLARQGMVVDDGLLQASGMRRVQIAVDSLAIGDPATPGELSGGRFAVREMEHKMVQSTPIVRERLRTTASMVMLIEQLGSLDGHPLYVRAGYYSEDDPQLLSARIVEVDSRPVISPTEKVFAELFGVERGDYRTSVQAVPCEEQTADALGVEPRTPVLLRESLIFDADGRPRSLTFTHYHPERVSLSDAAG